MLEQTLSAGQIVGMLVLQFVLILVNAFFAGTELAVMQLSPGKLRRQIEEGDKTAPRLLKMVETPSNFLSTIQIAITLVNFLGGALAADNFAGPLSSWFIKTAGLPASAFGTVNAIAIILITLLLSYFTLVLGELAPKQLALHRPYQFAKVTSGVIAGLSVVMKPLIKLLSASTALVLRLFGIKGERGDEIITEDEIRMMVDAGRESGSIDQDEKTMIDNVFELDKSTARDLMTHRVEVVAIEADEEPDSIVKIIEESGLSRYPVYDDSFDDILGVLSSRAYLLNLQSAHPKTLRELLRPARFVPESVRADVLLRDMQQCKEHMAIVLDEYGGFSGVVTMEDVIEELVGNIYDEFDMPNEEDIQQLCENLWRMAGDVDIEDIEELLSVQLPEERDYDTLGGLVFGQLSTIPGDGEEIEMDVEGLHIKTEPVEDHHITWALVSALPRVSGGPEDDK